MMYRALAALIATVMICGAAVAQGYHIQVAHNTNLRESYSLSAGIVETAPAGTTLLVTGQYGEWLKINHNGEAWMANWVRHTRVAAPATTASQPTNIDNCCFVDRQCSSDQEWTDGYWAFQNGQCAAPVQTQSPAPAQSSSSGSAPANVDNCCFIGWACATDDDWQAGYHAYQSNQCNSPGVSIEGSAGFVRQMENGFAILRDRAPRWYTYALGGLNKVWQAPPEVIGIDVGAASFAVDYGDQPPPNARDHDVWTASMFVHEACHVYRYRAGLEAGGYVGEKACTEIQLEATLAFAPHSRWNGWLREILANIDNPEWQWWLPGNY